MERVVESTLRGRHEVELLKTEEVGHGRYVVREHVLAKTHDTSDVSPPSGAPLRKVELLHHLQHPEMPGMTGK